MEKQKGFTLIELAIVIALLGILGYAIVTFFTNTYRSWWQTSQQIDAQQKARAALDEMTRFIRQARPVTALVVGEQAGEDDDTMITFTHIDGRQFQYYQSGDSLQRVVDGATTEVISEDLASIFFILDSTSSPTQVDISNLTVQTPVTGGQQGSITFPRKRIFLRNR
ncbi:prepilin-type N-terminal cleavage/methylation domain-containing protein [bacterium]|nr:prepilin-type N-terminal cleavage/methylation domain-containing protein [bacterium]NIN93198.1 prepilin-type N-terminal cleavage/methylation domain-containing protein [bacterium]NIO18995.1 prepilin-type N-terminal cleavage/methylation domain-containing protein [bacterium]NIO74124.1 prepilin-type N-terminal cleavage/methylation domain-containing protein [bacterium]